MRLSIQFVFIGSLLSAGLVLSYSRLLAAYEQRSAIVAEQSNEMLLFPNGDALQALAFGYNNFLANILWFKTVSYFGKHYKDDQEYEWLEHMCSVTIGLDSQARHIPEFCTLMLAWESGNHKAAIAILDQAIAASPYWRYYYLRGINNIIFLKNTQAAKDDFLKGAEQDDSPPFMKRLATKTIANLEDPTTAINFLKSMIARSSDPNEKESLRKHLKRTQHEQKAATLLALVEEYEAENGKALEDLMIIVGSSSELEDPYGGQYFWNAETRKVESTSGVPTGKIISKSFEERMQKK